MKYEKIAKDMIKKFKDIKSNGMEVFRPTLRFDVMRYIDRHYPKFFSKYDEMFYKIQEVLLWNQ